LQAFSGQPIAPGRPLRRRLHEFGAAMARMLLL
jgi:hypothetical protein